MIIVPTQLLKWEFDALVIVVEDWKLTDQWLKRLQDLLPAFLTQPIGASHPVVMLLQRQEPMIQL
jgi:hypothetical protein